MSWRPRAGARCLYGGAPVSPGLHTPESLIDPEHAVARLLETGAAFVDA